VRRSFGAAALAAAVIASAAFASAASADLVGPITFESPAYTAGDINGQQGWSKTGPYDVAVEQTAGFPGAKPGILFGKQALRLSDAVTSGSFGDQTFSPALGDPAGESVRNRSFDVGFLVSTTQTTEQPGLHMSVSPDQGDGSRVSYLRFEDQADGVHVFFDDVSDPGPLGTVANFSDTDIATLKRGVAHLILLSIDFKPGPHNDKVKVWIDGKLEANGTTWEDYYRYDPEQAGNGNQVPVVNRLLFRESGLPTPLNLGQGFLVDDLTYASSR
jgi:hypothetical protein